MNTDGALHGPRLGRAGQCRFSHDLRSSLLICVYLRFPFLAAGSQRTGSAKPRKFVAGRGDS
jgi:hypothetical protein